MQPSALAALGTLRPTLRCSLHLLDPLAVPSASFYPPAPSGNPCFILPPSHSLAASTPHPLASPSFVPPALTCCRPPICSIPPHTLFLHPLSPLALFHPITHAACTHPLSAPPIIPWLRSATTCPLPPTPASFRTHCLSWLCSTPIARYPLSTSSDILAHPLPVTLNFIPPHHTPCLHYCHPQLRSVPWHSLPAPIASLGFVPPHRMHCLHALSPWLCSTATHPLPPTFGFVPPHRARCLHPLSPWLWSTAAHPLSCTLSFVLLHRMCCLHPLSPLASFHHHVSSVSPSQLRSTSLCSLPAPSIPPHPLTPLALF